MTPASRLCWRATIVSLLSEPQPTTMSTLHLVFAGTALTDCLRAAVVGDAVLLLADGVYAAAAGNPQALQAAQDRAIQVHVHALDRRARGLLLLPEPAPADCDDDGFVRLTEQHARVVSWY